MAFANAKTTRRVAKLGLAPSKPEHVLHALRVFDQEFGGITPQLRAFSRKILATGTALARDFQNLQRKVAYGHFRQCDIANGFPK